jgi:hypothetical protein
VTSWPLLPVLLAAPVTYALSVIADGWSRRQADRRHPIRIAERIVKARSE